MSRPARPPAMSRAASSSRIHQSISLAALCAPALNEILESRLQSVEDPRDVEIRQLRAALHQSRTENEVLKASFDKLRKLVRKQGEGPVPRGEFGQMAALLGLNNTELNALAARIYLGRPLVAVSSPHVGEQVSDGIPVVAHVSPVEDDAKPSSSAGGKPKRRARSRKSKQKSESSTALAPAVEDEEAVSQEEERQPEMVYNPSPVVLPIRPSTADAICQKRPTVLPPLVKIPYLPAEESSDSVGPESDTQDLD